MLTMTKETHRSVDPDNSCPRCLALKARMRKAAEIADVATDRYGNTVRRGSKPWTAAYHAALAS